jgi:hypothetical protein
MVTVPSEPVATSAPPRRWPLFLLGVLLFVAGPVAYYIQFRLAYLKMPWYLPALATAGVLLMAVSVWQHPGVWRTIGLVLFAAACGFVWFMALVGLKAPPYTGQTRTDHKVPAFTTTRADREETENRFTNKDLEDGKATILLFFRGRW